MKEKILNNLGLKLIAIVLAILAWGVIVNITDPASDRTISGVTVHMINEDALVSKGYTYEILEGSKISVVVKGPKYEIASITANDIYATADFATISPISDYVAINAVCNKIGIEDYNIQVVLKTPNVKINIENRETKNYDVDISLLGNVASGYAVGNSEVSPMSVKITGAESIIESIDKVVAEYDVEGASLDIAESVPLKLYDVNGNEIDGANLVFSRQEARVKIPILVKKKLAVSYAIHGMVDPDYELTDVEYGVKEIEIAGSVANISGLTEIVIPAEKIDVTGLKTSKEFVINIGQFVPTNVKILSTATSTIKVAVEPLVEQTFNVLNSAINFENKPQHMDCEVADDFVAVTYRGTKANLEKLADRKIVGVVDLDNLQPGEYELPLEFPEIEKCKPMDEYVVKVSVSRSEDSNE